MNTARNIQNSTTAMLVAVPAIPPNPKIAAIIAITKNINAHPNMILTSAAPGSFFHQVCPYLQEGIHGVITYYDGSGLKYKMWFDENTLETHADGSLFSGTEPMDGTCPGSV